jgi:RHS repeat-associated protein
VDLRLKPARPNVVTGILGGSGTAYAVVPTIGFWPFGAVKTLNPAGAANFTQSSIYDTRLRPTSLSLSAPSATETLGYTWTVSGNLQQQAISNGVNPAALSQSFTYDSVNRLTSMIESGGSNEPNQYYGYDNTGNRSLLSPPSSFIPYAGVTPQVAQPTSNWVLGQTLPVAYAPFASNRYNVAHDAAGNETAASTVTSTSSAAYDAENRLQTVTGLSMGVLRYYYDGDGRRVMKVLCSASPCTNTTSGAQITTYVYDSSGQLVAEYAQAGAVTGTQYLFADHLGSTRMMLTSAGVATRCYYYAPFGEELIATVGSRSNCYSDVNYPSATPEALTTKFTSQERDAETGTDYFGARYFSAAQGRFTSPDEALVDQFEEDPQSWNLYSYVRNNPHSFVDPSGRVCVSSGLGKADYDEASVPGPTCASIAEADKQLVSSITVNANNYGSTYAFDYNGNYIRGSFRPPSAKETGIHDPTPEFIVNVASIVSDAQLAIVVTKAGQLGVKAALRSGVARRIWMPGFRRIRIDMAHIAQNHTITGSGFVQSGVKTAFSEGMSSVQIENAVRQAYRNAEVVVKGSDSLVLRGTAGNTTIEMIYDKASQSIRTAYPIK